ncbi:Porin P precursor [compost metagenome]
MDKQYGAWEVFYRYDDLSVEDDDTMATVGGLAIDESEAQVHTLGVNWYANEAVKLSLSYLQSQSNDETVRLQSGRYAAGNDDDDGQAVVMRAQYVF